MSDRGGTVAPSPFPRRAVPPHPGGQDARAALRARHDRAADTLRTGRADTVVADLDQVVADARAVLGPLDPDTVVAEGTLALAHLLCDDDPLPGLDLLAHNVRLREQVLGEEHPATLAGSDALAGAHRLAGLPDVALRRHEDVIVRRTRLLGADHPDTIISRAAAALALADTGYLRGAVRLLRSAVTSAEGTVGADHPVTDRIRRLLAALQAPDPADTAAVGTDVAGAPSGDAPLTPPARVPDPREETRPLYVERPSGPLPTVP